jgi:hypothetical protein
MIADALVPPQGTVNVAELIADGGALEQYRNLTGITSSEE